MSDEECEAAVVAGNIPEPPPAPSKPTAPAGTPVVPSLSISRRPRWNRRSPALRAAFQETSLSPANLVYPLFIHEGEEDTPIGAMPGCYTLGWRHGFVEGVTVLLLVFLYLRSSKHPNPILFLIHLVPNVSSDHKLNCAAI